MTSVEVIAALKEPLMLLGGGFMAMLGAVVQNRLGSSQSRSKLRLEKLERAYSLCQQVYDGHLREINNAKLNRLNQPAEFLKNRRHPGAEMSELKMVIRCYFPDLGEDLKKLDEGHAPLKAMFTTAEDLARSGSPLSQEDFLADSKQSELLLGVLGEASNQLKLKLAARARSYIS
jgi:hypothetical protein